MAPVSRHWRISRTIAKKTAASGRRGTRSTLLLGFLPGWYRVRHLHPTSTMMLFFRQISTAAARTVSFVLVLGIAIGGGPVAALAGVGCATSLAHCQDMAAHEHHCAKDAVVISCACDSSAQPATSSSTRGVELVQPGPSNGSQAYVVPNVSIHRLLRPHYSLGRGLQLVPLPILHASLLI